jgi:hypothetical protein
MSDLAKLREIGWMFEAPTRNVDDRNVQIFRNVVVWGFTYQKEADRVGLSREHVRQIVWKVGRNIVKEGWRVTPSALYWRGAPPTPSSSSTPPAHRRNLYGA